MNLQESIRRILKEEGFGITPIRRRISPNDMEEAFDYSLETNTKSMDNPNSVIYKGKNTTLWVFAKFVIDDMITLIEQEYFNDDNRIYFSDNEEDNESYHEKIRQPLLRHYGKRIKEKYKEVMSSNDGEMIQETIRRILREESEFPMYIRRRYICMDEYITKLENGEETLPIRRGQLDWTNYQIIITAFIRVNCKDGDGHYDPILHSKIMDTFGDRLYKWYYKDNINLQKY